MLSRPTRSRLPTEEKGCGQNVEAGDRRKKCEQNNMTANRRRRLQTEEKGSSQKAKVVNRRRMILTEEVGYEEKEKAADRKKSMPTEEEGRCKILSTEGESCHRNRRLSKRYEATETRRKKLPKVREGCRRYVKAADRSMRTEK